MLESICKYGTWEMHAQPIAWWDAERSGPVSSDPSVRTIKLETTKWTEDSIAEENN